MGAHIASKSAGSGSAWLARPRVLALIGGSIATVLLLFAAAIGAQQGTANDLQRAQGELAATRDTVVSHAAAMRVQGERLLATAQRSTSAHRQHWIEDSRQMTADAARLDDTARLLGNDGALLGMHPGQSVRSDLSFAQSAGAALVSKGEQLVVHGRAMREHASAMDDLARASETDITAADAALLRAGAERISEAGERTRYAGALLSRVGAQFMRSIGREVR